MTHEDHSQYLYSNRIVLLYNDGQFGGPDYTELEKEQFSKYYDSTLKSEGFRIDFMPEFHYYGQIKPTDTNGDLAREIQKCIDFAINKHNSENGNNLKLVEIKGVNYKPEGLGYQFYITFEAMETCRSKKNTGNKIYQTQVHYGMGEYLGKNDMEVKLFRLEKTS